MKALVRDRYGSTDAVELREVEQPAPAPDEVLVRVHASSVNPTDWYSMHGTPYVGRAAMGLRKPKQPILGVDFAGTVEAVGHDVTRFRVGDAVFGGRGGALAEYLCVPEDRAIVSKPAGVSFEQAAAVPVAALTALQGLRDKGQTRPGQKVLINGASGGVGTFAVQIAKALGAEVTGVCSAQNVELVRSLGADDVVDYTRDDFTRSERRYDVMIDVAGSRSWRECKRVLAPRARVALVGAPKGRPLLGPLRHLLATRLSAVGSGRQVSFLVAKFNKADMEALRELLDDGKIVPVVDRRYALSDAPEALRYLGDGHAHGKIVVTI